MTNFVRMLMLGLYEYIDVCSIDNKVNKQITSEEQTNTHGTNTQFFKRKLPSILQAQIK